MSIQDVGHIIKYEHIMHYMHIISNMIILFYIGSSSQKFHKNKARYYALRHFHTESETKKKSSPIKTTTFFTTVTIFQ